MSLLNKQFSALGMVLLLTALPVHAEAPVYDADTLPQAFYNDAQDDDADAQAKPQRQVLAQQDEAFVPQQQQQQAADDDQPAQPRQPAVPLSLDQRVKRTEQQIANMQNGESAQRIEALQAQVQTLQGQVEQLTHQSQQLQDQLKTMYADLDKRVTDSATKKVAAVKTPDSLVPQAPAKPAPATAAVALKAAAQAVQPVAAPAVDQPNVQEEQKIYQAAYNQIKAKRYSDAVSTLQGMLKKYPSGQFAANAHYWLGELYGLMGQNDQALIEFSTVASNYPDSPRIADAELKVGLILSAQTKWADAKNTFKKIVKTYPETASSRLAAEQLKEIKQAGH